MLESVKLLGFHLAKIFFALVSLCAFIHSLTHPSKQFRKHGDKKTVTRSQTSDIFWNSSRFCRARGLVLELAALKRLGIRVFILQHVIH